MSKPEKKKNKKERKAKSRQHVEPAQPGGRLVALEGANGPRLAVEAVRLARLCCGNGDPAWSQWDASNTFHELGMVKARNLTPTPRTLLLLYASDLLFRLRWEIEPTLKEGRNVVAAPYVESAVAFGVAGGLPKEWLEELFSFAPKPVTCLRLKEKKKGKKKEKKAGKTDNPAPGFVEFSCASLKKNCPGWDGAEVRAGMMKYFKDLEEQDQIRKFGKKLPKSLAKALTR
jgi:hypothetical protein